MKKCCLSNRPGLCDEHFSLARKAAQSFCHAVNNFDGCQAAVTVHDGMGRAKILEEINRVLDYARLAP